MQVRDITWFRNQEDLDREDSFLLYSTRYKYIICMFSKGRWRPYPPYNIRLNSRDKFEKYYLEWRAQK